MHDLKIEDFSADLEALGLAPDQQAAFFDALVMTMQVFVDRAFGKLPIQKVAERNAVDPSSRRLKMVGLKNVIPKKLRQPWNYAVRGGEEDHGIGC